MCGVPIEILDYSDKQKPVVMSYSTQQGNINLEAIRKSNFTNAFEAVMTYGLSPKQIQAQAVIQVCLASAKATPPTFWRLLFAVTKEHRSGFCCSHASLIFFRHLSERRCTCIS